MTLGSQGDLVIVQGNGFSNPTGVTNTGSALTFTAVVTNTSGPVTFTAPVTAAAAGQTCTITVAGSPNSIWVDELVSGLGVNTVWVVSNHAFLNTSATTVVDFPSVTTGSSGVLAYWGSVWCGAVPSAGVSPVNGAAFTYTLTGASDTGVCFSGAVAASTAYQPTATMSSSTNDANAITLSASVPSSLTSKSLFVNQAVKRASYR